MDNRQQEDRQQRLEEVVAHQQRLLEELNQVLTVQQADLATLGRRLTALEQKYLELAATLSGGDLPHERPPHY